jgi:hypothetical protein
MKVLIVDDNDQSLYLLRTQLEHAGHEVWRRETGEALAVPASGPGHDHHRHPDAATHWLRCAAVRRTKLAEVPAPTRRRTPTPGPRRDLSVGADRYLEADGVRRLLLNSSRRSRMPRGRARARWPRATYLRSTTRAGAKPRIDARARALNRTSWPSPSSATACSSAWPQT